MKLVAIVLFVCSVELLILTLTVGQLVRTIEKLKKAIEEEDSE